jgi:cytidine deaminase
MKVEKIMAEMAEGAPSKKHRPTHTHYHIAALFKHGKLLSIATNRCMTRSSSPCSAGYTIHAERNAIYKLGDVSKLKGATMVVIRVLADGSLGESKPCHSCQQHLKKCMDKHGLLKVFYSQSFSEL